MTERSKMKKVGQEPEMVTVGGKQIPVRPMVIKEARGFRNEIKGVISEIVGNYEDENWQGLLEMADYLLGDKLIELAKSAAPKLAEMGDEWIENNATEPELQTILAEAIKLNYPWLKKVVELGELGKMYEQAKRM